MISRILVERPFSRLSLSLDVCSRVRLRPVNRYDEDGYTNGTGLLRLHSTYRHDLKIYSSDEGRVQVKPCALALTTRSSHIL